jgi:predicted HTH domain antitoxin
MTQVTIPIADNILASLNMRTDEIARSMCREFALKSFQSGKLTLVQAAALCGMNIYDFISTASKADIPIIDYSIEEIDRELALLNDNRYDNR